MMTARVPRPRRRRFASATPRWTRGAAGRVHRHRERRELGHDDRRLRDRGRFGHCRRRLHEHERDADILGRPEDRDHRGDGARRQRRGAGRDVQGAPYRSGRRHHRGRRGYRHHPRRRRHESPAHDAVASHRRRHGGRGGRAGRVHRHRERRELGHDDRRLRDRGRFGHRRRRLHEHERDADILGRPEDRDHRGDGARRQRRGAGRDVQGAPHQSGRRHHRGRRGRRHHPR